MKWHSSVRLLMRADQDGIPPYNFTLDHSPEPGDPFDPTAHHHRPMGSDSLELFRGQLMEDSPLLGHRRRPVWVLLSAGVVMRSHVCSEDGSDFMTF